MCKFCNSLNWREYKVPQRSEDSCDNLCEVIAAKLENIDGEIFSTGSDCSNCNGCIEQGFEMFTYENMVGFSYSHNINEVHIGRNSEMFKINFCPWCGSPLASEQVDFEKCCLGMELKIKEKHL